MHSLVQSIKKKKKATTLAMKQNIFKLCENILKNIELAQNVNRTELSV